MKRFTFYWTNGAVDVIEARSVIKALTAMGYGRSDLLNLESYRKDRVKKKKRRSKQ